MPNLLGLLKKNDPVIVSSYRREQLEGAQIPALWKPHTCLELVPCPYCQRVHRVHVRRNKQYFFTCGNAHITQFIHAQMLTRWRLNLPNLLNHITSQLAIQPRITKLHSSALWRLGIFTLAGSKRNVECWLCRRITPSVLVWLLNHDVHNHIAVLTLGSTSLLRHIRPSLVCLDLSLLVLDSSQLYLDRHAFHHWIALRFQRVLFDTSNGDLWVDGKRVCTALPASAQFFFLECLWKQFDQPVSHEDIFTYCRRKLAKRDNVFEWHSEYLPPSFCHAMKRLLKKQAYNQALCDEVIQATRTHTEQTAYRLTSR